MQCLNRSMLERYDIPFHAPAGINAVQFGAHPRMLGLVDRIIDDSGLNIGIACVETGNAGYAKNLSGQDGMFTVFVRGYLNDKDIHREQVVQCILRAIDPEQDFAALSEIAQMPGVKLAFLDMEDESCAVALGLAAKLLAERKNAGLPGLTFICLGENAACAAQAKESLRAIARSWDDEMDAWIDSANDFYPAMGDCLTFRSAPEEAAKLCADMNYADSMIHIAEPYADFVIQAPEAFRMEYPFDRVYGARFVDDIAPEILKKHRVFDAGLCLMAGPGYLAGCDTLRDCMKNEKLREFVGRAFFDEIIPNAPFAREEIAPYIISTFERFENPMNNNPILRSADHLFRRFMRGIIPVIRKWADENFEAPTLLGHALAAAIMLYAGARTNAEGVYEVARGEDVHTIFDDRDILDACSRLSHDMPCESLAYAALADRTLWDGQDLREIDGLESRVIFSISSIQQGGR